MEEQIQEISTLDEIIAGLRGFGIEEFEDILTINVGGRQARLRISNIPTEDEMNSIYATEEYKGYSWVQRIKCEILSRSISWINGVSIRNLTPAQRLVADPTDQGIQKDIQVVMRNLLLGWGIEVVAILWKVLMVHAQRIEDRLTSEFPDSAILTEVEKRLIAQAEKDLDEVNREIIRETVSDLYKSEGVEMPKEEETT